MAEWFSIEVFDGASSAALWSDVHGDALLESALGAGAVDWSWHRHNWGVVLELAFEDEASWDRWHLLPLVGAALDAVPDPVTGLIVYKGRGGSAGDLSSKRPKPLLGSGSVALPLPWAWEDDYPLSWSGPFENIGSVLTAPPSLAGLLR